MIDSIFYILILIVSVVIHEVSHGFAAEHFGDHTARDAGRLTLNPLRHVDLFGSIVLPALLVLTGAGILFGWAKPVPYNPLNLRNRRLGTLAVASAGVGMNLFIAAVFGLIIRFVPGLVYGGTAPAGFYFITSAIVIVNISLAVFNLVPIPPLDGSKILFTLLPESALGFVAAFEQYSLFILLAFVIFFADYLYPVSAFLFRLITGFSL